MQRINIDTLGTNLQIQELGSDIDFWVNTPLEGFDSPEIRMSEYDKPGEDGSVVSSMFYDSRPISLRGVVRGLTPALLDSNRRILASACAIKKDANGYPVAKRVSFVTLGGESFYFDAYFKRPIFDLAYIGFSNFLLQMTVPGPFIYGSTVISSAAIVRASGGGFILPVILPIVSSGATGGSATLNNIGNANSYPIITLTGPLTNPYISNTAAGKSFQVNYFIPGGSTVTINMLEKTILLDNSSSLLPFKGADSDWFPMVPGNNQISFSTGSTADTGNMIITFNPAYLGT